MHILYPRLTDILQNISAPRAAKLFHFHADSVHMFPKPQAILPGVFRHQELPKHYIVICIKCTYTKGKPIFSKISWNQQLLKYSIFMCIECAYYSKGKAIFSEIFQHQQLPKHSIFMCINCTYYTKGKAIFHCYVY